MQEQRHKPSRQGGRVLRSPLIVLLALAAFLPGAQAQTYTDTRTSGFSYFDATAGAKKGLLKNETIEPGNAQLCVTTSYDYDGFGNKVSATTANCAGATGLAQFQPRSSGSTYAALPSQAITVGTGSVNVNVAAGLFPTTSTNALGHSETRTYDPRFGAALTLTGPNGLTTGWKLDDFGRPTKELRADGTSTVTAYCTLASSGLDTSANSSTAHGDPVGCPTPLAGEAPANAVMFVHSLPLDATGNPIGPYVRVYKDRLGRDLRSVTESFDGGAQTPGYGGAPVYKDVVYNLYGVKELETQAYFAATISSTTTGVGDVGVTKTVVDVLGRPTDIYVADPRGQGGSQSVGNYGSRVVATTHFDYAGLSVTTTNDKGQTRTEDKNALGELVRVTDATGATLIHQRDAFGNLVKTRDALGNTTTLVYDTRGRKTQLQDPDTGVWNYDYDALGQLVRQQSPNQLAAGTQTTMAYDVLGRMTSRTEPEYVSTWRYDANADGSSCMNANASQGKGKLCQSGTSNGVSRQYVYDNLGRPSSSRTSITNGPSFASAVTYDAPTGRLLTQTYPTGVQVGYGYTPRGFLQQLVLNTAATITPLPNAQGQTAAGTTLPAGSVLWQARLVGAWGRTEQQLYGNGITHKAAFEAATGRITDLTAGPNNNTSNTVLAQHYTWDSLNNLTGRSDDNGDGNTGAVTETFAYADNLNRLTSYTVSAPAVPNLARTVNLQYNALGMLLYKSDVGNYSYGAQGGGAGSRPHALQSVAGAVNTSYTYDANGNLSTASAGKYRSLSYTSFNLPDSGNGLQGPAGGAKYSWQYDENHARIKEVRQDSSGTRTTWHLHPDNQGGLGIESEIAPNGAISNRHYLSAGGQAIAVLVTTGALPTLGAGQTVPTKLTSVTAVKLEFWHKDHLGSLVTTTDHNGAVTARYAYDPFGKRRFTNGTYDEFGTLIVDWSTTQNAGTDRGYTGHEHLDDVGVIHMNGRLFDPTLGVFMQADPLVQDPTNLQNFNRYGYCYNNPLTCTDPSGFSFWTKIRGAVVRIAAAVADVYGCGGYCSAAVGAYYGSKNGGGIKGAIIGGVASYFAFQLGPMGSSNALGGGYFQAAVAGFASGVAATGDIEGGMKGAFTAAVFYGAGDLIQGAELSKIEAVMVHGVAGCVTSTASGGKCGPGALSAAFSKAATVYEITPNDPIAGTVVSAVIGGTASALGGDKFSNGATTAAFGYLFNHWGKRAAEYVAKGAKWLAEEVASGGFEPTPGKSNELTFVTDSGVRIRVDGVFQDKNGNILFGEAKIGNFADLTKNQRAGFDELQHGKGRFVGEGAGDLRRALGVDAAKDGSFRVPASRIVGVYIATYERTADITQRMKNHNDIVGGRSGVIFRGGDR